MSTPRPTAPSRDLLVTPEAVAIDLPVADVASRALALIVDLFVMLMMAYVVLIFGGIAGAFLLGSRAEGWLVVVLVIGLNFAILWGYPVAMETLWGGRTIGKAALGLRVVATDGSPVRLRHAAVRWILAVVDHYLLFGIPAILSALLTRRVQRLGDLAAGTLVIRERSGARHAGQPVTFDVPLHLRGYAATLDISSLTAADYALVRDFLLRAHRFDPSVRADVGREVADAVATRMGHTRPVNAHPEALLVCVAGLLQER